MRARKILATPPIAGIVVLLGLVGIAAADIEVTNSSFNPAAGVFSYQITLSSTTQIANNDGFVIYDFGPVVGTPTLTAQTGGGGLTLSDFTISTTGNSANSDQGNSLTGAVGVNMVAQADADVHFSQLPSTYPDPSAPGDGLATPTFDNSAVANLNFVFNQTSAFTPGTTQTYLLTLMSADINSMNEVSRTEADGEDQNTANDDAISLTEQIVDIPLGNNTTTVSVPEPSLLSLLFLGGVGMMRRRVRANSAHRQVRIGGPARARSRHLPSSGLLGLVVED